MRRAKTMIAGTILFAGALSLGMAGVGAADDETADTSISIQAPIDAVACDTSPQTISVLGLTIDIGSAVFEGGSATDCAGLQAGRTADLALPSDAAPLKALTISTSGGGDGQLQGPVQAVDPVGQTIQILGLTISTIGTEVDGADDNSSDGTTQVIDLTQLMVGQYVAVELDSSSLPALVASKLELKNFTNQVDVQVDDSNGNPIDDASDDITAEASDTTLVTTPTGTATHTKRKTVHVRTSSNGSFSLSGLPVGRARVTIKRTANGKTRRRTVVLSVQPNTAVPVTVKLRTN